VKFDITNVSSGLAVGAPNTFTARINDIKKTKFNFIVIPNPTFGTVYLVDTDLREDYTGNVNVILRRSTGEIIYSGSGKTNVISEALSNVLRNQCLGIYLLNVNADGAISSIRILKL
jgi:hypothetical protein